MTLIKTTLQLSQMVDEYYHAPEWVFDIETVGENRGDPRRNQLAWISFASTGRCDVLPLWHPGVSNLPDFDRSIEILRPLFFNKSRKIGHNVKFDLSSLVKYFGDIPSGPYGDTIIAGFLYDQKRKNKNAGLGAQVLRDFGYSYDKSVGKFIDQWPFKDAASYSYRDSKYTWLLWQKGKPLLEKHGLWPVFDLEMDVLRVLVDMETHGAPVAEGEIDALDIELAARLEEIKARVFDAAGYEFNLNASAAKGKFVYEVRGHKPREFTAKTNKPSTAAASLEVYSKKDPIVADLLAYADLNKLHGTYVKGIKPLLVNGRLHADFIQYGAETGRFSCRKPNLQNIPRPDTEFGKRLRGMFHAPYKHSLIVADYSQVELRVLAHYSQDPTLLKAFADGLDIHQATAEELGCTRTVGKAVNFAIPFGAGPQKISLMSGCSEREARKFLDLHAKKFPRVAEFKRAAVLECRSTRPPHVTTILGRKRFLPEIMAQDYEVRGHAERQAINTKIQGSAADVIKLAMVRLYKTCLPEMQMILTVHDELVTICPDHLVDEGTEIVRVAMEEIDIMKRVRLTANIVAVKTWDAAK